MATATAITAKYGRSLHAGNDTTALHHGRISNDSKDGLVSVTVSGRQSDISGDTFYKKSGDIHEPPISQYGTVNNSASVARREFFQGLHADEIAAERRRNKASDGSSGYISNSSGESDTADDVHTTCRIYENGRTVASCPQSPHGKISDSKLAAFSSPSSSSSANSLTYSSGVSPGVTKDPRSAFTDEIWKVLEEDGLIHQALPRSSTSPLSSMNDRRASAEYNVIELSRQYRKKELSQLRASEDKFQIITDTYRLQQMLDSTEDEEKRRAIRQRMAELKCGIKENSHSNGQRARSLSTRESVTLTTGNTKQSLSTFASPIRDPATMLGGIASLTLATSGSPCGKKCLTPTGQTTRIIARTPAEIKAALLRWCQLKTRGYPNVLITNFTRSWCDGMAFCALIHHFFPNAFDFSKLSLKNRRENFELAFRVAEEMAGIVPLLEVDDMIAMGDNPEYKCVYTYVQTMYKNLHILEPRPSF